MGGVRSVLVGFGLGAVLLAASGCGSSTKPTDVDGVSARSVVRALVSVEPPRPTGVSCRTATSAQSTAFFGPKAGPVFSCELTITRERASYVVQVLHDGCFVAERRRPGRAVYGCGVARS